MASWWTITVPPGFQDVTAEAMQNPAFKASLDKMTVAGGTVTAHFWTNEDSVVLVLDASFADMPNTMETLDGFEAGARKTSYGTGTEHAYTVEKDAFFIISHQHATNSAKEVMWSNRWTGRGTDGALHSVGATCSGNEGTCKAALATVKVDSKDFVKLSSLGSADNGAAYRIGYAVGVGLVCALLIGVYAKTRARKRAISGP